MLWHLVVPVLLYAGAGFGIATVLAPLFRSAGLFLKVGGLVGCLGFFCACFATLRHGRWSRAAALISAVTSIVWLVVLDEILRPGVNPWTAMAVAGEVPQAGWDFVAATLFTIGTLAVVLTAGLFAVGEIRGWPQRRSMLGAAAGSASLLVAWYLASVLSSRYPTQRFGVEPEIRVLRISRSHFRSLEIEVDLYRDGRVVMRRDDRSRLNYKYSRELSDGVVHNTEALCSRLEHVIGRPAMPVRERVVLTPLWTGEVWFLTTKDGRMRRFIAGQDPVAPEASAILDIAGSRMNASTTVTVPDVCFGFCYDGAERLWSYTHDRQ